MHEGHRARMRARYLQKGLEGFAPHEIFEILLFYTNSRKNTNPVAHKLIDALSPAQVFEADVKTLTEVDGIGRKTADFLKFVGECMDTYKEAKSRNIHKLKNIEETASYIMKNIEWGDTETLYMLCFNINKHLLSVQKIGEGKISGEITSIRNVVECALRNNAYSVVFAHNHPDGVLAVSQEDINFNNRLREALWGVETEVIDHIVISGNNYISMAEKGFFKRT